MLHSPLIKKCQVQSYTTTTNNYNTPSHLTLQYIEIWTCDYNYYTTTTQLTLSQHRTEIPDGPPRCVLLSTCRFRNLSACCPLWAPSSKQFHQRCTAVASLCLRTRINILFFYSSPFHGLFL